MKDDNNDAITTIIDPDLIQDEQDELITDSVNTYMYGNSYNTTVPTTQNIGSTTTSTITIDPTMPMSDIEVDGDIKVGGKSLKDFMEVVSERLNILTPNPELLEKYDALKEAYEHYKILEKLCTDDGTVHEKT